MWIAVGLAAAALATAVVAAVVVVGRGGGAEIEPAAVGPVAKAPIDQRVAAADVVRLDHLDEVVTERDGVRIKDPDLAKKLGLQPDDVIVSISGRPVTRQFDLHEVVFNTSMMNVTTLYVEIARDRALVRWLLDGDLRTARYSSTSSSSSHSANWYRGMGGSPSTPSVPRTPPDPLLDKIVKVDDTHYTIPTATVDAVYADPQTFARGARIVPSIRNGLPDGIKVYAIRPSSILRAARDRERRHDPRDQRQRRQQPRQDASGVHEGPVGDAAGDRPAPAQPADDARDHGQVAAIRSRMRAVSGRSDTERMYMADDLERFLVHARGNAATARLVRFAEIDREAKLPTAWELATLRGRLVELSARGATATLTTAIELVVEAQLAGDPVAWLAPASGTFYPPDVADSGVDLAALVVVRVPVVGPGARETKPNALAAARVAERLLRSGAFGLVVLELGAADSSMQVQGRLVTLAQTHDAAVVCLTEKSTETASLGSLISLRAEAIRVRERDDLAVTVRVLKDKRRGPGWSHTTKRRAPAGL